MHNTFEPGISVLRSLRDITPIHDHVHFSEALRVAEIQAALLLQRSSTTDYPVLNETITELPRIELEYVRDLPTSGCSFWNGHAWIIQLSTQQSHARQRFTLFHEYKHVVDHGYAGRLYRGDYRNSAHTQAELAADYFAGCALVPRKALTQAWRTGIQRVSDLAEHFDVSQQAIEVRLVQTGLRDRMQRCSTPSRGSWRLAPYDTNHCLKASAA